MEPVGEQHLPVAAAAADKYAPAAAIDVRPFFIFLAGADTGAQQKVSFSTDERDWGELEPNLVSEIAERALRSDVTEYIRLRAVCKPWRRAAEEDPADMGMNPRFFPRNWEMAEEKSRGKETSRFVNAVTGASIQIKIPREFGSVIATAEGCLLFALDGCGVQGMRLFNPVTRAVADLPGVFLPDRINLPMSCDSAGFIYETEADAGPPTVVLCARAGLVRTIVYTKPGDTVWRVVVEDHEDNGEELVPYSDGAISVRGRLYVPTPTGDVRRLELQPQPHLVYAARQEARHRCDPLGVLSYLIPEPGDGMLLVRNSLVTKPGEEVFSVNVAEGTLTLKQDEEEDEHFLAWLTLRAD